MTVTLRELLSDFGNSLGSLPAYTLLLSALFALLMYLGGRTSKKD